MKLKLLTHVAAAALLVSTAALAQTGGGSGGSGGSGGAPSQGGPSIQKAPGGGGMQQPDTGGRQQLEKAPGGGAGGVPEPRAGQGTEKQPGTTGSTKQKEQLQRGEKQPGTDTRAGERKERMDGKGQARESTRGEGKKGAGGAGMRPDLSQEQRTTIRERLSGGPRAGNLNVNIAVGTRLPREVQVRPLPATVVEIVPQYRGYAYVLVGSQIVIVDPDTLEIVAVLAA